MSKSLEARYHYGEVLQEIQYNQIVDTFIESMLKYVQTVLEAKGVG